MLDLVRLGDLERGLRALADPVPGLTRDLAGGPALRGVGGAEAPAQGRGGDTLRMRECAA
jgi:hypothetical protein